MEKIIKALKSRNINCYFVKNKEEARKKAISLIDQGKRISWGGSVTLEQTGILKELRNGSYKLLDRDLVVNNIFTRNFLAKYGGCEGTFISGTNAITEDGKIVNMDGLGNRVNAINYGPEKVIIVIGKNKIVRNMDAALERICNIAAPANTKKLKKKTPCVEKGKCVDCRSSERICNILSVVQFQNDSNRIHVIIVDEELGF